MKTNLYQLVYTYLKSTQWDEDEDKRKFVNRLYGLFRQSQTEREYKLHWLSTTLAKHNAFLLWVKDLSPDDVYEFLYTEVGCSEHEVIELFCNAEEGKIDEN